MFKNPLPHLIPTAPHHFQVAGLIGILFNFFPDMPDMYGNGIVGADCPHMPGGFVNLTDREYLSPLLYQ